MKKFTPFFVVFAGLLATSISVSAHHSRGGTYDMKKQVTLKGTVTEVAWRNPHVAIYIDVKEPDGKVVNWAFENSSVSTLARQGYSRTTLKVGQEITAVVNPSALGAPRGIVVKVILADGKEVMSRETGANPVD
jgi:hypothetical protein